MFEADTSLAEPNSKYYLVRSSARKTDHAQLHVSLGLNEGVDFEVSERNNIIFVRIHHNYKLLCEGPLTEFVKLFSAEKDNGEES
jgi:hypothetical protein